MKLLYYTREWVKRFYPPDTGASSGAAGSGNQPAASSQQQQSQVADPFEGIDLDSLDDVARGKIEAARTQIATLQKAATDKEREARQHQSERDRTEAELRRVRQSVAGDQNQNQPKAQTTEERVYAQLIGEGLTPEAAKPQAKVLAKILDTERQQLSQQLGHQFAPVATLALENQATSAFSVAQAQDHVGWTQIPEVSELVWQSALELARNGQQADVTTIKNLAFMHFCAYTEKNPQVFATLQTGGNQPNNGQVQPVIRPTVPAPTNVSTGFTYPGANFVGRTIAPPNPNAARTVMDSNTFAAVSAVTNIWKGMGLNPKG